MQCQHLSFTGTVKRYVNHRSRQANFLRITLLSGGMLTSPEKSTFAFYLGLHCNFKQKNKILFIGLF